MAWRRALVAVAAPAAVVVSRRTVVVIVVPALLQRRLTQMFSGVGVEPFWLVTPPAGVAGLSYSLLPGTGMDISSQDRAQLQSPPWYRDGYSQDRAQLQSPPWYRDGYK